MEKLKLPGYRGNRVKAPFKETVTQKAAGGGTDVGIGSVLFLDGLLVILIATMNVCISAPFSINALLYTDFKMWNIRGVLL